MKCGAILQLRLYVCVCDYFKKRFEGVYVILYSAGNIGQLLQGTWNRVLISVGNTFYARAHSNCIFSARMIGFK